MIGIIAGQGDVKVIDSDRSAWSSRLMNFYDQALQWRSTNKIIGIIAE